MKSCRTLAIALILVLISSPAMAAMCAAKCAANEMGAHAGNSAAMASDAAGHHCDQPVDSSDKHQHHAEHNGCNMAGCHISASAVFIASAQFSAADFSNSALAYFNLPTINAELPPPIKPPA